MIGLVFLMRLVTKNAILLVDFANRGQRNGMSRDDALLAAGQVRLRPILMTTAAMTFGMLPLALGLGEGAEQQAPIRDDAGIQIHGRRRIGYLKLKCVAIRIA